VNAKEELAARDRVVQRQSTELAGREAEIRSLSAEVANQANENMRLKGVAAWNGESRPSSGEFSARESTIAFLSKELAESQHQVASLNQALAERERTISALLQSRSWKVTRPVRLIGRSLRKAMPNARRRFRLPRALWLIRKSGLFDSKSYLEHNSDVGSFRWGPLWHYLLFGVTEGRDPHPLFCTTFYLQNNRDVAEAGVNPLFHYVRRGAAEGRDPHPLFDSSYYLEQYPDVAKAGMNPLAHYLAQGACEGCDPHPLFDSSYYLEQYPDVAKAGVNPLEHYLRSGGFEGRDPRPQFDSSYYLKQNPDVTEMRINPLVHYVGSGSAEGRDPNPSFDTSAYLENNPEVALKGLNPLVHYLMNVPQFNLRAALHNEFQLSGRVLLDSDHDSHPLVSVIIPCFNDGHFLEDAVLSSLLACSYPLEIIVVDDGSTDHRSVILMDALAEKYKFTLVRQANAGLASARNAGIRRTRGKFIQFLDADDLLTPGKIDIQLDEFRSDPTIDICISEYEQCDADGLNRRVANPSTIAGFSFSRQNFLLCWERGLSIPIHCALFRRELLERTTFQLVTHAGKEDWIFWVELSSQSPKFKFNPAVLATYRLHGRNMVNNHEGMGLDFLRACMYIVEAGLNKDVEGFLRDSVQHFHTAYLGSIKHEAILRSSTHTEG
jgi:hypothetical protein